MNYKIAMNLLGKRLVMVLGLTCVQVVKFPHGQTHSSVARIAVLKLDYNRHAA